MGGQAHHVVTSGARATPLGPTPLNPAHPATPSRSATGVAALNTCTSTAEQHATSPRAFADAPVTRHVRPWPSSSPGSPGTAANRSPICAAGCHNLHIGPSGGLGRGRRGRRGGPGARGRRAASSWPAAAAPGAAGGAGVSRGSPPAQRSSPVARAPARSIRSVDSACGHAGRPDDTRADQARGGVHRGRMRSSAPGTPAPVRTRRTRSRPDRHRGRWTEQDPTPTTAARPTRERLRRRLLPRRRPGCRTWPRRAPVGPLLRAAHGC
ncbi:hypothetical protein QJS66_00930 [Kocuria rhizophila]|nr:hypothetical protein QJS66_00930 [Kocuria rhizophila]